VRTKIIEMPGFIKPQLATLKAKDPKGDQWLHEIKFDGYRVQAHINRSKKKIYTRNGMDWTKRFSQIASSLDIPGLAHHRRGGGGRARRPYQFFRTPGRTRRGPSG
jgi:ATP-dependent DNA ligase